MGVKNIFLSIRNPFAAVDLVEGED